MVAVPLSQPTERSRHMSEYRQTPHAASGWAAGGVVFAGVMLILLAIIMFIAEIKVPSYGLLTCR